MNSDKVLLQKPCLGRPIALGMLYDCRRDNYMSDSPVGDSKALTEATTRVPQEMFEVKIIVHDSFVEKANCLEIDNELQLSLLSGLVDVQGAAKLLTAHRSSIDQPRISLVYQSTTRLEELSLEKVASQCADTRIDKATHMVTKVQYGANAAFVFDASGYTHDDLLAKISELKKSLSTSAVMHIEEKAEAADIMCTFYADIPCPKEPATFSEASLSCCSLAQHLKEKDHCIPVKIWLCPLSELNNRAHKLLLHEVSPKLADKIKGIFDSLNESDMQIKHVMNNQVCKHFFESDLRNMISMLAEYNLKVRNRLATLLPQIREGAADEAKLVEVLDDTEVSPFSCTTLRRWIVEKEKEVRVLLTNIRTFEQEKRIKFAFQPNEMDLLSKSMDTDTYIVCFDFNISGDRDNQLANMRAYLDGKEATCTSCREEFFQPWYDNTSIAKEMDQQVRIFKQLATDNVKQDNIAFVVTNGGSKVAKRPDQIPCLCLYSDDSEPVIFEPLGKPGKPQVSLIGGSSIQLMWERAETRVLAGPEHEPSDPIVNQASSLEPPGKPYAANITHCSVTLQWNKPQSGQEQNIKFYTVCYRTCDPLDEWKTHKTSDAQEEAIITNLSPAMTYFFKVRAETGFESSPESKISDAFKTNKQPFVIAPIDKPFTTNVTHNSITQQHQISKASNEIQTKPEPSSTQIEYVKESPICVTQESSNESTIPSDHDAKVSLPFPGKPQATYVTHNSVQLKWDKPQDRADEKDTSYTLYIRSDGDPPNKWSTCSTTYDESFLVTNLQQCTTYIFKVSARCSGSGYCPVSAESDPITTKIQLSQPSKPYAIDVTHNNIQLRWDRPAHGAEMVESYKVVYSTEDQLDRWSTCSTKPCSCDEYISATVSELQPQTKYVFKVLANGFSGFIQESAVSDPIETKVVSSPSQPYPKQTYQNSIELEWNKPAVGAEMVVSYKIYHHVSDDPDRLAVFSTKNCQECCTVPKLHENTCYTFKVSAETPAGESKCSEASEIRTADVRLAKKLLPSCTIVEQKDNLFTYQLQLTQKRIKKEILKVDVAGVHMESLSLTQHKVLMLVGATGAGKSTLINGIANYILGVNWEDEFRFRLISDSERGGSQTKSQTKHVTAYTFHEQCSTLPYTLTVIDTPGFGETGGLVKDKKHFELIREFFSSEEGVEQLNAIGFVAQANQARLTPTHTYIFETILSIFGKDIGNNIFLMATFSDGAQPLVLQAANEVELPYQNHFKFNNSALFASTQGNSLFNAMFWQMGMTSFSTFFDCFSEVEPRSLTLTREVLQEREQLKTIIRNLQPQICKTLTKIEELKQVESVLKKHKDEIDSNKNFKVKVLKTKKKQVQLPENRDTTLCLVCNVTCHDSCTKARDKKWCFAMKTDLGKKTARCGVCPGKCSWKEHSNAHFLIEEHEVEEETTFENIKARYDLAVTGKNKQESAINKLNIEIERHDKQVSDMVDEVKQCVQRLHDIALKPTAVKSEADYIELLIESTKLSAKPGWQKEVQYLQKFWEEAHLTEKVIRSPESVRSVRKRLF